MTDVRRRQRLPFGVLLGLVAILGLAGCGNRQPGGTDTNKAPQPSPWIKADPNPVTIPDGSKKGTTTISWDTGDGSDAQVFLQVPGKPDQLFSGGSRNHANASWISKGGNYEFVLYAGKEHQKELARVTVTGAK